MRMISAAFRRSTPTATANGFTLLEAVISLAILAILVTSVFTITFESLSLLGDTDAQHLARVEAGRALDRIVDVLRKSGRVKERRVEYPRVLDSGAVLEFRLPDDLDGDGHPFDAKTGATEWSPAVFSIQSDAGGTLSVYRSGTPVYAIAQHVRSVRFETPAENPARHLREVSVDLDIRKTGKNGQDVLVSISGSAYLRN